MAENLMVASNAMEKIVSLCKRRGFVFQDSEIYGGIGGFWDFGPLGVLLKNNIKHLWWKAVVLSRDDVYGFESTIISHPAVWKASGHKTCFSDPLVECKKCHKRFRADKVSDTCSECGGTFTEVKQFNMMFQTRVGPVDDTSAKTFLRPETAQGIFVNFANVLDSMHPKIPFGIAQIGKAFRNEITHGDFIFRDRELEQMELEYFVKPGTDEEWFERWKKERMIWYLSLGFKRKNLRFFEHPKLSLAHYSKRTVDIEYNFPFGWSELEGIANRIDFDLKNHSKHSGRDLSYFDEEEKDRFTPYVIEPSVGVERVMLALFLDSYREEKERVVLSLHPLVAPIKVAVFPLLANKPKLVDLAQDVFAAIRTQFISVFDDRGNIGKRYYAQDEIGTPFCVTVDFQSLEDGTVTVRNRDTTRQERVNKDSLKDHLTKRMELVQ